MWLRNHDEEAFDIASRARRVVQDKLDLSSRLCYLLRVLQAYAETAEPGHAARVMEELGLSPPPAEISAALRNGGGVALHQRARGDWGATAAAAATSGSSGSACLGRGGLPTDSCTGTYSNFPTRRREGRGGITAIELVP